MRAVINLLKSECEPGWDVIFIIRKSFSRSNSSEIRAAAENLLLQADLLEIKEKIL